MGRGRVVAALLLLLLPAVGAAQAARRYSGRVERVEPMELMGGLVVVEELGPRGRRVRHEVHVEAATPIVSTARLRPREMRGPTAYSEVPVSLADLLAGDFVVVESVEEGGRVVARRITIVEVPSPTPR